MIEWLAERAQHYLRIPAARTRRWLRFIGVAAAATVCVLIATALVAFDSVFLGANNIAALQVGDIAPQDIRAPYTLSYISDVLTAQRQQEVRDSIAEVYFPPDPDVARQQTLLAQQILTFIDNIRRDPFASAEQKYNDLRQITDLTLENGVIEAIFALDDQTWRDISDQITSVLERVMRGEIRETNLPSIKAQLPTQVSVRFNGQQTGIIVALVEDLIRPNTLPDPEATQRARDEAAAAVEVRRSFERGQIIARAGERLDEAALEALSRLGLLEPEDRRLQQIGRALLASVVVMIITGMYISRFQPDLYHTARLLVLLAAIFLIFLAGARVSGAYGQIYIYPFAALALIYVALIGLELAVIGTLGLGALVGVMQNNALEIAMLVAVGGLIAALNLRRPERLNGYFKPGLLVGAANSLIVTIFYQTGTAPEAALGELVIYSFINGILAAAVALGGLYLVTLLFNLPTGLKLIELSQPNQPLLQRLLREAPGTYQHSLQVANLAEQAANAIGANADLVRVSAMYHDIGKMLNAPFFTENQVEGLNPHDALNDPVRSADIIISHVTDGEKMARQYRLPLRIRDFILEHHGTQVLYFYQQAVDRMGDNETVDIEQFTYPGPRPRSRETAILMMADSCEAAVRSRKPTRKQDIADTVHQIIDIKVKTGQLDNSGLTLGEIKTIKRTFIDLLQAVFHPRISYPAAATKENEAAELMRVRPDPPPKIEDQRVALDPETPPARAETPPILRTRELPALKVPAAPTDEDAPLPDVPPLPRANESRTTKAADNGQSAGENELSLPEKHPE